MVVKLLILLGIAWLVFRGRRFLTPKQHTKPATSSHTSNMVECTTCHVHVPLADAILKNGEYYCCRDHLPDP